MIVVDTTIIMFPKQSWEKLCKGVMTENRLVTNFCSKFRSSKSKQQYNFMWIPFQPVKIQNLGFLQKPNNGLRNYFVLK